MVHSAAFGSLLRARRRALGLTQGQLGAQAGISAGRVQQLEVGGFVRLPSPDVLAALAESLHLPLGRLLATAGYGGKGDAA